MNRSSIFGRRREPAAGGDGSALAGARSLEQRTQEIGRELLTAAHGHRHSALSRRFWSDRLMRWAMDDPQFKTQLFRFIDVYPALRTPEAVRQHLTEYLQRPGIRVPPGLSLGMTAAGLLGGSASRALAGQIESLARTFIAGRDLAEAMPILEGRWREGVAFSVDLLGEACISQAEAETYRGRYAQLVEELPALTAGWPASKRLESDHLGRLPRCSISVKVSALDGRLNSADTEGGVERLFAAVAPLLRCAAEQNVLVYFDMEQHALKEITFSLFRRCCEEIGFAAGLAVQAYLVSAEEDVRSLLAWSQRLGRSIFVRLIKGAYWDYETIHARLMGWPSPVWQHKHQTDACFEGLTRLLLEQMPRRDGAGGIRLALGTHNARSVAHAMACLEEMGLPPEATEFQMLRGMADELKAALVERGARVREYSPIGELLPGMAYLVRRLLENSSNEGFIRASESAGVSESALLAAPGAQAPPEPSVTPAPPPQAEDGFANEPHRDFADASQRRQFAEAVRSSSLPSRPADLSVEEAASAVARAADAFAAWRDRTPEQRAACLMKAAAILRGRRDELATIEIREAAKPWAEADADVCEAIDFCEFYAREAVALFHPQPLHPLAGEENRLLHEPRGVAVVISPWNFPLAICTGMTAAALVTGNTALLKPAEQTPRIAAALCEAMWKAGVPREALQLVPGPGETVGAAMAHDPRVALVAFTGSSAVGLGLLAAAAPDPVSPSLPLKHVVCEMGGKNAIIIDASADLDEAVPAVCNSAFGYAGQKCSACSRVIVLEEVHGLFVPRLVEAAQALRLGEASEPATDVGPLIDDEAAAKVWRYIDIGRREARLLTPLGNSGSGRLVAPHIFDEVPPDARIAREEIFGPVLCILRARDFGGALRLANASDHKLTGGVFSRTPSHLERATREFRVGNLYLNRGTTGALVGRQPFGGFGLSGLGTQAGGREYLLHFTLPRTVAENTLRRGFAPEAPP